MKEKIIELENLLNDLIERIEQRLEIEQIDLEEFDRIQNSPYINTEKDMENHIQLFRAKIVEFKSDKAFWEKDLQTIVQLLVTSKDKIQTLRQGKADDEDNGTKDLQIGGKDKPNNDIINLLQQCILSTQTQITKTHSGRQVTGHLTEDGYLEIDINGVKKKLTLRRAALYAWEATRKISGNFGKQLTVMVFDNHLKSSRSALFIRNL